MKRVVEINDSLFTFVIEFGIRMRAEAYNFTVQQSDVAFVYISNSRFQQTKNSIALYTLPIKQS